MVVGGEIERHADGGLLREGLARGRYGEGRGGGGVRRAGQEQRGGG